jgi:hypothetical protein
MLVGVVSGSAAQTPPQEGIAASVNGEILTWRAVSDEIRLTGNDETPELRQSTRRTLVDNLLLRQYARRVDLVFSDEELDAEIPDEVARHGRLEEHDTWIRVNHRTPRRYREWLRLWFLMSRVYWYLGRSTEEHPELAEVGLDQGEPTEADLRAFFDANPEQFAASEQIALVRITLTFATDQEEQQQRDLAESFLRKLERGADILLLPGRQSGTQTRKQLLDVYPAETVRYLFETLPERTPSSILTIGKTLNVFLLWWRVRRVAETFEQARGRIRTLVQDQVNAKNRQKIRAWLRRKATLEPPDLFAGGHEND